MTDDKQSQRDSVFDTSHALASEDRRRAATAKKTARLRALRLEREVAEREAEKAEDVVRLRKREMRSPGIRRFKATSRVKYREGRCYELAGKVMLSDEGDGLILVHGTALNLLDDRHPHAWLELPDGGTWCPVAGRPVKEPLAERRYTRREFLKVSTANGHWGPWS
jgi:hypothetical protein